MAWGVWIIIVNYRTADMVVNCLQSIARQIAELPRFHAVVVDNAPCDGWVEKVMEVIDREGWAGNVYVAADRWLEAEKEWEEARRALDDNDWIEVRYEDLISSARPQLERICTFLDLEYSEKMFDYVRTSTYRAPDVSLNYQWKTGMRKVDVQQLEKLGDRLLSRGYELSSYPRISVPGLTRKYLYLRSRVNAFLFRLSRYGAALMFQETLSRRFGLNQVHQKAVSRINRIDDANLR